MIEEQQNINKFETEIENELVYLNQTGSTVFIFFYIFLKYLK